MRRRSTSRVLLTRKALCPDGVRWRVFLLEPKPIYVFRQSCSYLTVAQFQMRDAWERHDPSSTNKKHSFKPCYSQSSSPSIQGSQASHSKFLNIHNTPHTEGITICPLKRLRTLLSIPFGFLQLAGTRMKRSDWCLNHDFLSTQIHPLAPFSGRLSSFEFEKRGNTCVFSQLVRDELILTR